MTNVIITYANSETCTPDAPERHRTKHPPHGVRSAQRAFNAAAAVPDDGLEQRCRWRPAPAPA
jgi:hypothetical protein